MSTLKGVLEGLVGQEVFIVESSGHLSIFSLQSKEQIQNLTSKYKILDVGDDILKCVSEEDDLSHYYRIDELTKIVI